MRETRNYQDLLDYLQTCSPEQLLQPIQITDPNTNSNTDEPVVMLPAIAIGTMEEMEFEKARSSTDNKFHPEQIVILSDHNLFDSAGVIGYDLTTSNPMYGKDGQTNKKDQINPKLQKEESND